MPHFFQKQIDWFFSDYRFKNQTYWFKFLLYALLTVKSLYWLFYYEGYFGLNSVIFTKEFVPSAFTDFVYILYVNPSPASGYLFIIPLLVMSCASLLFRRSWFVCDVLTWLIVLNLHNKLYPALTGGSFLLNQFLLFNCFLSFSSKAGSGRLQDIKVFTHNLSITALMVQVCIVYFLSALAKCVDGSWISGTAFSDLVEIKHFNLYNTTLADILSRAGLLVTYFIIFYQFSFPVMIWIKKIKIPLIILGVLMHLYIAFVMGLTEFGLVMILPYIFFWPFKKQVS